MTSSITRKKLSASTSGRGITITGNSTGASVALHVPSANADEVHLWISNNNASDLTAVIELGTASNPIYRTIPSYTSLKVLDGITSFSSMGTIAAWSLTGSTLAAFGYVNEIA